jgi:hypothetical protein
MHLSLKNSLGKTVIAQPPAPGVFNYIRFGTVSDLFRRPDGTSLYKRPLGS